jgi:hypothetical protein
MIAAMVFLILPVVMRSASRVVVVMRGTTSMCYPLAAGVAIAVISCRDRRTTETTNARDNHAQCCERSCHPTNEHEVAMLFSDGQPVNQHFEACS